MQQLGLYIHIPFCFKKCPYCDFYSLPFSPLETSGKVDQYLDAVEQCLLFFAQKKSACFYEVDSIYFGGGTPSLLSSQQLLRILEAVKKQYVVLDDCEITLEANPCSVTPERLTAYRKAGINRISFGVQSVCDNELTQLGRLHSASQALQALRWAQEAGFENISADLMLGISEQTPENLRRSMQSLCDIGVSHVSAYLLKIEPGTPYAARQQMLSLPNEDEQAELYLQMCNTLPQYGYRQYEISNFAKPGFESRHNLKYWQLKDYLGIGPAAHSCFKGERFYFERNLESFLQMAKAGEFSPVMDENDIDQTEEYIMLALRLTSGIDLQQAEQYGISASKLLERAKPMLQHGLMNHQENHLFLTPQGFLVSNEIIARLTL